MPQKLPSVIVSFVTHVTLESVHSRVNGRMIPQSPFTDKSLFTVLTGKIFAHVNSHVLIISINVHESFSAYVAKVFVFSCVVSTVKITSWTIAGWFNDEKVSRIDGGKKFEDEENVLVHAVW